MFCLEARAGACDDARVDVCLDCVVLEDPEAPDDADGVGACEGCSAA